MKKALSILFFSLFISVAVMAKNDKNYYVRIKTSYGECIIRLYNQTPKHRDNFIKIVKAGTLNGTLFHRVINEFMVQGGDPDSKNAKPGMVLGEGTLGYTVPAEFNDSLFHKRGVLAAARDDNPEKASSASQFYLVQGKRFTDDMLNSLENTRLKGRKIPEKQREYYKAIGGVPHLDQNYTVYGEIVIGMDMVDMIAATKTDTNDRPLTNIPMTVELLSNKQSKQLDKLLGIQ